MDITYLLPELFDQIIVLLKNNNIINIISLAFTNKRLHKIISTYAKNNSIKRIWDCKYAALTNRIEMMEWALDINLPNPNDSCTVAAIKGNLDMFKLTLNRGLL